MGIWEPNPQKLNSFFYLTPAVSSIWQAVLVVNLVRAQSSWRRLGAKPSTDRSPNQRRIVWRGPYENNCCLLNACLHLLIILYWDI